MKYIKTKSEYINTSYIVSFSVVGNNNTVAIYDTEEERDKVINELLGETRRN